MNITNHFRNGKTFSAYCRYRYGQSKQVWEHTELWQKEGDYVIAFDQTAADKLFPLKEHEQPAQTASELPEMNVEVN